MKTILKVDDLTCKFNFKQENEFIAIKNFSFEFKENKIYFIIGNSGSGKSTLISHFNGLLKSKWGSIKVDDFKIDPNKSKIKKVKELRRIVSMVFQFPEYQLFKTTIYEDVAFGPAVLGIPKIKSKEINLNNLKKFLFENYFLDICNNLNIQKKDYQNFEEFEKDNNINFLAKFNKKKQVKFCVFVKDNPKIKYCKKIIFEDVITPKHYLQDTSIKYLNKLGIPDSYLDKSPFELSGGQKRRVAIAGILAIEPKILVFDEPTAGLDPKGEQEMIKIISDAKKSGQTVIVITHSMDQVLELADEVIVLDQGKLLYVGEPYEIFCNQDLYLKTKMEKPKIIDFIDDLVVKNKKFSKLYEIKPKNIEELCEGIKSIL